MSASREAKVDPLYVNPWTSEVANSAVSFLYLQREVLPKLHASWNANDVVSQFVVPATLSRKCHYADLLSAEQKGPPTMFLSHAWSNMVARVAATQDDLTHLEVALKHATHIVIVVDEKGLIFTRAWCLLEMLSATKGGYDFGMCLPIANDHESNLALLHSIHTSISFENAQAFKASDVAMIKDRAFKDSNGNWFAVNARIKDAIATNVLDHVAREYRRSGVLGDDFDWNYRELMVVLRLATGVDDAVKCTRRRRKLLRELPSALGKTFHAWP